MAACKYSRQRLADRYLFGAISSLYVSAAPCTILLPTRSVCTRRVRTISTLVGRSGREYKREKVLKSDPRDAAFDVYLARYV